MKMKLKSFIVSAMVLMGAFGVILPAQVNAVEDPCSIGALDETQKEALGCNGDGSKVMTTANNVINTAIALIGVVAVIGLILGGIQYVKSAGDVGKTAQAKNTIIWSIIGLIVTLLAFAVVNFVLKSL